MEIEGGLTGGNCRGCAWRDYLLKQAEQTITGLRHALARWRGRAQARPPGLVRRVITRSRTHWGYDLVEVWATEYPDTLTEEEVLEYATKAYAGRWPAVGDPPPPPGEPWAIVRLETRDRTWLVHRMTAWEPRRREAQPGTSPLL